MPNRIIFPEFRDEFEFTKYPFTDTATLVASDTGQALERDTFLDASLYVIGAANQVRIARIEVETREVTIWISDRRNQDLASAVFDPLNGPEEVEVTDLFGRPAGVLVSDAIRLARFSAWQNGTHTFPLQAAEFVSACVIPTPETGVRGLVTADGEVLAGDVWLVGENGVVVREDPDNECTIRIDIVGDPLFVRQLCVPIDLFNTPNFLRTINDCPPDKYGDFKLEVGANISSKPVLRINPVDDGLKIEAVGDLVRLDS